MGQIKSLMKDTAIYGVSSIVGRFLNWCLVPLYTIVFPAAEYGEVSYVYSYVALVLMLLTYGMETGFFRFANHDRWKDPMQVYSTALISLAVSSSIFIIGVLCCLSPVTHFMKCDGHENFVVMMTVCVAIDAFTSIPFAYLRYRQRPIRFAYIKIVNIGLNIGLNLFFILACPWLMEHYPATVSWFYNPNFGIGYIFLANLVASVTLLVMLTPELRGFKWQFCGKLWREMLRYSWPLLVLGLAGIMNQNLDKILLPSLASNPSTAMTELGIYSACYKIAIIMVMFLQAFRFAYDPFIYAQAKKKGDDSRQAYAEVMLYFMIFALLIFLGVMFYLDIIKYIISSRYFSGLDVVPIVMIAELFFGIFFNLSVWYKLKDQTQWGMYFSLIGLAVTVGMNVLLVPRFGYMGCAWAAFGCYGTMMVLSYVVGQKKYPINYPMRRIFAYVLLAAVLYVLGRNCTIGTNTALVLGERTVLLIIYVLIVVKYQKMRIPGLSKLCKK